MLPTATIQETTTSMERIDTSYCWRIDNLNDLLGACPINQPPVQLNIGPAAHQQIISLDISFEKNKKNANPSIIETLPPGFFGSKPNQNSATSFDSVEITLSGCNITFADSSRCFTFIFLEIKLKATYSNFATGKVFNETCAHSKTITSLPSSFSLVVSKPDVPGWDSVTLALTISAVYANHQQKTSPKQSVLAFPLSSNFESLLQGLKCLYDTKEQSDVELQVESVTVPAHRFVLAARSEAFRALLKDGSRTVHINDMTEPVLKELLHYFYTDRIERTDLCMDLVKIAKSQSLKHLEDLCKAHLLANLSVDNCLEFLAVAHEFDIQEVESEITEFTVKNIKQVQKMDAWHTFTKNNPTLVAQICTGLSNYLDS